MELLPLTDASSSLYSASNSLSDDASLRPPVFSASEKLSGASAGLLARLAGLGARVRGRSAPANKTNDVRSRPLLDNSDEEDENARLGGGGRQRGGAKNPKGYSSVSDSAADSEGEGEGETAEEEAPDENSFRFEQTQMWTVTDAPSINPKFPNVVNVSVSFFKPGVYNAINTNYDNIVNGTQLTVELQRFRQDDDTVVPFSVAAPPTAALAIFEAKKAALAKAAAAKAAAAAAEALKKAAEEADRVRLETERVRLEAERVRLEAEAAKTAEDAVKDANQREATRLRLATEAAVAAAAKAALDAADDRAILERARLKEAKLAAAASAAAKLAADKIATDAAANKLAAAAAAAPVPAPVPTHVPVPPVAPVPAPAADTSSQLIFTFVESRSNGTTFKNATNTLVSGSGSKIGYACTNVAVKPHNYWCIKFTDNNPQSSSPSMIGVIGNGFNFSNTDDTINKIFIWTFKNKGTLKNPSLVYPSDDGKGFTFNSGDTLMLMLLPDNTSGKQVLFCKNVTSTNSYDGYIVLPANVTFYPCVGVCLNQTCEIIQQCQFTST
jgi:hypothetical protein